MHCFLLMPRLCKDPPAGAAQSSCGGRSALKSVRLGALSCGLGTVVQPGNCVQPGSCRAAWELSCSAAWELSCSLGETSSSLTLKVESMHLLVGSSLTLWTTFFESFGQSIGHELMHLLTEGCIKNWWSAKLNSFLASLHLVSGNGGLNIG